MPRNCRFLSLVVVERVLNILSLANSVCHFLCNVWSFRKAGVELTIRVDNEP